MLVPSAECKCVGNYTKHHGDSKSVILAGLGWSDFEVDPKTMPAHLVRGDIGMSNSILGGTSSAFHSGALFRYEGQVPGPRQLGSRSSAGSRRRLLIGCSRRAEWSGWRGQKTACSTPACELQVDRWLTHTLVPISRLAVSVPRPICSSHRAPHLCSQTPNRNLTLGAATKHSMSKQGGKGGAAAAKGKKPTKPGADEKREDVLQAVILADSFLDRFKPFTLERPRVCTPVTGKGPRLPLNVANTLLPVSVSFP